MEREKVIELLKNYRSYVQAIYNYEHHIPVPSAGVANYSGMPGGSGAPELFFVRVGKMADMGHTSAQDAFDYDMYKAMVHVIERTVNEVLDDNERYVILHKWLERNRMDLYRIAIIKDISEVTVKRWHKSALKKLSISLAPIANVPKIEEIQRNVM